MKLYNFLKPELIKLNCRQTTTEDLLKEIVHDLKIKDIISDESGIQKKLMEREKMGTTSIGNHTAVPHTKLKELKDPVVYVGISKNGMQYHIDDKELVHLIILILSPNDFPIIHLQILAAAATLVKKKERFIKPILAAETPEELITVIKKFENPDE